MQSDHGLEFNLGQFVVLPEQNKIILDGQDIKLEPKVMDVLCYLYEHHTKVVSADELADKLWEGTTASNQPVQRCISQLRKVLRHADDNHQYIVTFSKKGYQLVLPPQSEEIQAAESVNHLTSKKITSIFASVLVVVVIVVAFIVPNSLNKGGQVTDFSKITPFTSEEADEYSPEPHPDNMHIAYVSFEDAKYHLWLKGKNTISWKFDSSEMDYTDLSWSADGQYLATVSYDQQNNGSVIQLFHFDWQANKLINKQIIEQPLLGKKVNSITWKNVKEIVFSAVDLQKEKSFLYNLDIKNQNINVQFDSEGIRWAQYQVKTRYLATARTLDKEQQIVIDIQDPQGKVIHSSKYDYNLRDINWLPNGQGFHVTIAQGTSPSQLIIEYLDGDKQEIPLLATQGQWNRPRYSPDGQTLFASKSISNVDIWRGTTDQAPTKLVTTNYNDWWGLYSHSGEQLAYLSERSGSQQLWLKNADSDRQLSKFNDGQILKVWHWTRDDSALLLQVDEDVILLSVKDGRHQFLVKGDNNALPIDYDDQENILYFVKWIDGKQNIWLKSLVNGNETQITDEGLKQAFVVDNKFYYTIVGQDGLWLRESRTDEARLLDNKIDQNTRIHMDDTQDVFYWASSATFDYRLQTDIYHLDLSTGEHRLYISRGNEPHWQGWVGSVSLKNGVLLEKDTQEGKDILMLE